MDEYESLSHSRGGANTKWSSFRNAVANCCTAGCRSNLGEVFRKLAEQKESRIYEGHLLSHHVHMMISILPKYAVSQVVGFIKGKSAIFLAPTYGDRKQNYAGQSFW